MSRRPASLSGVSFQRSIFNLKHQLTTKETANHKDCFKKIQTTLGADDYWTAALEISCQLSEPNPRDNQGPHLSCVLFFDWEGVGGLLRLHLRIQTRSKLTGLESSCGFIGLGWCRQSSKREDKCQGQTCEKP
ncbi:hypothetical protein VP01_377g5 [Puccinia sorghi]|uniref:Uncharacterized protein n=1 Tax=Puccinia sorghi TaxID=27349 RepID=A0A0L6UUG4_9BASI|nr:hypothetical protein VP01_377g5 [Puccinia sorghi]